MAADQDWSPMQVQVWPVLGERSLYYIRLRTSHYSFCLRSSCVIRDITEFYQLKSILNVSGSLPCEMIFEKTTLYFLLYAMNPLLQTQDPCMRLPYLPLQPMHLVFSYKTISKAIATFISKVNKELLQTYHLFLYLDYEKKRVSFKQSNSPFPPKHPKCI